MHFLSFATLPLLFLSVSAVPAAIPVPAPEAQVETRAPADDRILYRITRMTTSSPSGRPGQTNKYVIDFDLWDHNKATNASTTCHAEWNLSDAAGWPHDYVSCADDSFSFYIKKFNSISNFTLAAQHSYKDSRVGDPPMDIITTFARTKITPDKLQCICAGSGFCGCGINTSVIKWIKVKIYAMIA